MLALGGFVTGFGPVDANDALHSFAKFVLAPSV